MKYIKIKIIFLALILFVGFSITPENIHAQSCGEAEWNSLKQKYGVDELLQKEQEIVRQMTEIAHDATDLSKPYDAALFNSLQMQFNSLDIQLNNANAAAERECAAIGADKADQLRTTVDNSQPIQSDEEQKLLWAEYERALQNSQNSCPSNSRRIGDGCWCNAGYTNNSTLTGCIKVEPTPSPFTLQQNKQVSTPTTQPTKNIEPTNRPEATETSGLGQDNSSEVETGEIVEEQPQQGFITRVVNFVKNIFSKIFRL